MQLTHYEYFTVPTTTNSKYLFVSDIHGYNENLFNTLDIIAENYTPEIVFFLGDIVGTDLLAQLQRIFYNDIVNPLKELLRTNHQPTDEEILTFVGKDCKKIIGNKIIDGCHNLYKFLRTLDTKYNHPHSYADLAKELSGYAHFGHFVSNLPKNIRTTLKRDMIQNATYVYDLMKKFTKKGSLVVLIEGNWDARTPLDFEVGPTCIATPPAKREFSFKRFIKSKRNKNILYFDRVGTIKTNDNVFVIWPFDCATTPTQIPEPEAGETRKTILVAHAQLDWAAIKRNAAMTGESKKVKENMELVIRDLKPAAAVHGHLHDDINFDGYIYHDIPVFYLPLCTTQFIDF